MTMFKGMDICQAVISFFAVVPYVYEQMMPSSISGQKIISKGENHDI